MDQAQINTAVKHCIRQALGADDPLTMLQSCTENLRELGWNETDLQIVHKACIRMLAIIYETDWSAAKAKGGK
jgi:hypothetical protein